MLDFIIPFPAPFSRRGSYDDVSARYMDFQIGKDYHRWHWDVGVQINRTLYREYGLDTTAFQDSRLLHRQRQFNAGLAASADFALSEVFHLGVNYYPSFWSWKQSAYVGMEYTHLLMFELVFKIKAYPLRRRSHLFRRS